MLQLFVLFYLLRLPPWVAGIGGLAINYSAYEAEIYRAGLQAIPAGQMEAALALGMSRRMALRRVIVPQAVRIVIPPVTNDFIALFKDTSVCSVITLVELTKQYSILANSTGGAIEFALATAVALHDDERSAVVVFPVVRAPAGLRRREGRGAGMIEVDDLVKRYGPIEVLRGVNLAVARGEVAAIIGPSGSGKSTFLRCLNGLETFQAGRVTVDGLRLDATTAAGRAARIAPPGLPPGGHGVSELQPVPAPDRPAERGRRRPSTSWGCAATRPRSGRTTLLDRVGMSDRLHAYASRSSRAASSSGSRSPGPWRWSPRRCSSTSRPARSTRG